MELILEKLIPIVGSKGWKSPNKEDTYSISKIADYKNEIPSIILLPRNTEDVIKIMQVCNDFYWPVSLQGRITGLTQGTASIDKEVILSLERMDTITNFDKSSQSAIVETGITQEKFNLFLEEKGLFFPFDTSAKGNCFLGKNLATNVGGSKIIKYGLIRNRILGVEVVLADGTLISSLDNSIKGNLDYDLNKIFLGTSGMLGIITKASLKFFQKPKTQNIAFCGANSFDEVINLLKSCKKELGSNLSAFEVIWKSTYEFLVNFTSIKAPLPEDYEYYVLIENLGNKIKIDDDRFSDTLRKFISKKLIRDSFVSSSQKDIKKIWNVRNNISKAFEKFPLRIVFNISININHIPKFVAKLDNDLQLLNVSKGMFLFGNIANNNLQVILLCNKSKENIKKAFYKVVAEYSASISYEHEIGLEKKSYLNFNRSKQEIKFMKELKSNFDPHNILNRYQFFKSDLNTEQNFFDNFKNDEFKEKFRPEFLSYLRKQKKY